MASLIRRMQRQLVASQPVHIKVDMDGEPVRNARGGLIFYANPPRQKFFGKNLFHGGRGSRLGVTNPKGRELLARKARDAKWGRV